LKTPGAHSELIDPQILTGDPASTDRFLEIGEGEDDIINNRKSKQNDTQAASMKPKIRHNSLYFDQIRRFLHAKHVEDEIEDRLKKDALMYELKDDVLYLRDTGVRVITDSAFFEEVVGAMHKDLGHYGKKTTLDGVAARYVVTTDIRRDGAKELDACVPCQIYKSSEILTDNGEEFRGSEFEAFVKRYHIRHNYTSPRHPQTNGKVERLNHEIIQCLQRISAGERHQMDKWNEYLPQALLAFHGHRNQHMGCSPFYPIWHRTSSPTFLNRLIPNDRIGTRSR